MQITPPVVSKAIAASFGKYDSFRKARGMFMGQMVGRFYNRRQGRDKEENKASPLNLLYNAVGTLVPNLVFNDPKVRIRTEVLMYREYGTLLELATNFLIDRIDLRTSLRKSIYDSIFMAGFINTGIASGDQFITMDGVNIEIGQPFAERVDPDDMILDPWARDWHEQAFMGKRFRANLDDLIATGLYKEDELNGLSRTNDIWNKRYASKLSGGDPDGYGEVQKYLDLCEVYFPREKVVVTLPYYQDGSKAEQFLRIADYNGPDTGPYHMLGFTPVSDNLLPVAPAGIWYDLHQLGNRIARKLARQAERLKSVLAYTDEAQEDAEEIADADDGETVRVKDVNQLKEVKYGGAAPEAYEWMQWVKQNFSEQAGNIEQLGGQGSDLPTLGQAEIVQANTSVKLGDMQSMVYTFTGAVVRDLSFYLHTDPLIDLPLIKRVNGMDTQVYYTPEMREGNFFDFTFKIRPHSMARTDPNMIVRRKIEFATSVIPAATQSAMMLGPGFRVGPFLRQIAADLQMEDADEFLDDPAIQQYIMQKVQASMMMGDPGKAGAAASVPPVFNPAQPVPTAMGPTGGVSPATEGNMAQQESSAEVQSGRQKSAKDMATARV